MRVSLEHALKPGDHLYGWTVQRVTPMDTLRCVVIEAEHDRSGARLVHLWADDPENLLSIGFRTPPRDHTGLPHILEHTVLCGSGKYPVKDPFVELLKTSLATFLNAMTYPDKTVYPCCSMNEQDFFNLAGVYCDAVFNPLITEEHFKQEGHHLDFADLENPESDLVIKGVVYNEMKGAYSTLDGVLGREDRRLFPDNAYGLDSGGDPVHIPELTYQDFVAFHRKYYHPSNAYLITYGNLPTEKHLAFLDRQFLHAFQRLEVDSSIAEQPRWNEPRVAEIPYPAAEEETPDKKTAVLLAFLANPITEPLTATGMSLLGEVLLGHAGSPLRKALIDSQLGEDLTSSGYGAGRRDTSFEVGLKGIDRANADQVVDLVMSTCGKLVEEGIDPAAIEASLHQAELEARSMPDHYPLYLMDRIYNSWIYDSDPLQLLDPAATLAEVRQAWADNPRFFEDLLRTYLVDNPHRLTLIAVPDAGWQKKRNADLKEQMARKAEALDQEERRRLFEEARALNAMQSAPNTPEALATLPRLQLKDMSPDPVDIPVETGEVGGRPLLRSELFTNRLAFLDLGFDLGGLDEDLVPLLPAFCSAITGMGADGLDYAALAEREAALCGGFSAVASVVGLVHDAESFRPLLSLGSFALDENVEAWLELLESRLLRAEFGDHRRLLDILTQQHVRRRHGIVQQGNLFAHRYAQQFLSRRASWSEQLQGLSQVRTFAGLMNEAERSPRSLEERFEALREFLLQRERVVVSAAAGDASFEAIASWSSHVIDGLPSGKAPRVEPGTDREQTAPKVGVALPSDGAYVARAFRAVPFQDPHAPALLLLGNQLSYGYLWNEVRVKGGAYGCHARYVPDMASFTLASYRDPGVGRTLGVYDNILNYVREEMPMGTDDVAQYMIGSLKSLDRPIRPPGVAHTALTRHLAGSTPDIRRAFRDRLLSLSGPDIIHALETVMATEGADAPECVLSSPERLERAIRDEGVELEVEALEG